MAKTKTDSYLYVERKTTKGALIEIIKEKYSDDLVWGEYSVSGKTIHRCVISNETLDNLGLDKDNLEKSLSKKLNDRTLNLGQLLLDADKITSISISLPMQAYASAEGQLAHVSKRADTPVIVRIDGENYSNNFTGLSSFTKHRVRVAEELVYSYYSSCLDGKIYVRKEDGGLLEHIGVRKQEEELLGDANYKDGPETFF